MPRGRYHFLVFNGNKPQRDLQGSLRGLERQRIPTMGKWKRNLEKKIIIMQSSEGIFYLGLSVPGRTIFWKYCHFETIKITKFLGINSNCVEYRGQKAKSPIPTLSMPWNIIHRCLVGCPHASPDANRGDPGKHLKSPRYLSRKSGRNTRPSRCFGKGKVKGKPAWSPQNNE